jgi:hypothetical protein
MSSAEEDPVLRRALFEYFYQLLQLPTLSGSEPDRMLKQKTSLYNDFAD